jgi:acyl-CoA synthetase (AMP-forming)/AMP-acid ligase II
MAAQTVFQAFEATAEAHTGKPFLLVPSRAGREWSPRGATLVFGDVLGRVRDWADAYRAAGYGHGHRVALLLEQRPEFVIHYLALNALGVGIVPINPDYRHDEMLYQMSHSEAEFVVALPHRMDDLVRVGLDRQRDGGAALPVIDGLSAASTLPPSSRPASIGGAPGLETEAGLLYTSGTTGRPKGCRLSNFY